MNRDLTCLKERWRTLLCQQHANLAQAQKWLRSLLWEPDQTCLWTDLPDPGDVYARDKTCFDSYN